MRCPLDCPLDYPPRYPQRRLQCRPQRRSERRLCIVLSVVSALSLISLACGARRITSEVARRVRLTA
jgi:hypothetical protein